MVYADYAFYKNEYFGNAIPEGDFPRLASRASDYIRAKTGFISDNVNGWQLEAVKKCTCAIADILLDESIMEASAFSGGQAVSSESVGSWSKSYASPSISSAQMEYIDKRKIEALYLYLSGLAAFASIFRVKSYRCVPGGH